MENEAKLRVSFIVKIIVLGRVIQNGYEAKLRVSFMDKNVNMIRVT